MIAAISREKGIEAVMCFPKSINVPKYKVFLEEIRRRNPYDNIIIMQDNLGVHRNRFSIERMNDLGFRYTFTPRYSPEYNGIEEVFSISKSYIKRKRLN